MTDTLQQSPTPPAQPVFITLAPIMAAVLLAFMVIGSSIDMRDIAERAAAALTTDCIDAQAFNLMGPGAISYEQAPNCCLTRSASQSPTRKPHRGTLGAEHF